MRPRKLKNHDQKYRPVRLPWTRRDWVWDMLSGRKVVLDEQKTGPVFMVGARFFVAVWTPVGVLPKPLGECWWEMCQ